jgi:hypothetical protein
MKESMMGLMVAAIIVVLNGCKQEDHRAADIQTDKVPYETITIIW